MEECLMKVVDMFNYVTDKDLFAEQYRSNSLRIYTHVLRTFTIFTCRQHSALVRWWLVRLSVRSQLGRRLLHQTSASVELEKALIAKLRLKCGAHFTAKLEGMVTDLDVAAELMKSFHNHQTSTNSPLPQPETAEKHPPPSLSHSKSESGAFTMNFVSVGTVEFSVQTLSTTHWPAYPGECYVRTSSTCESLP